MRYQAALRPDKFYLVFNSQAQLGFISPSAGLPPARALRPDNFYLVFNSQAQLGFISPPAGLPPARALRPDKFYLVLKAQELVYYNYSTKVNNNIHKINSQ